MAISKITSDAIDVTGFNLDGDVGIGTAPSNKLDVLSSGAVAARFKRNNTGGASGGISVGNNDKLFTFYVDNSGGLQFYEDSTERIRFQLGGGISFNGDTAAANALDDYEEGTWTPNYSITSATFSMGLQVGVYVKVGRMVTASCRVRGQRSGGSGSLTLTGLPFTTDTTSNLQPAASIGFTNGWSASPKGAFAGTNSTIIGFKKSGSTSALSNIADDITHSDVSTSSTSSNDLILSITYMTS